MNSSTCKTAGANKAQRGAFTLVELLVVIGIIALLIGILMPALSRARRESQEIQCMNNLRQWGTAYQMYANDNGGAIPNDGEDGDGSAEAVGSWDGSVVPTGGPVPPPLWFEALPPYLGMQPYDQLQNAMAAGGLALPHAGDNSLYVCPAAGDAAISQKEKPMYQLGDYFGVYGLEDNGSATLRPIYFCYVPNSKIDTLSGHDTVQKLSQLRPGALVALMVEKRMSPKELPPGQPPDFNSFVTTTLGRCKSDWQRFAARHRYGGYVMFADGHVDWFLNYDVANFKGALSADGGQGDWNQPAKLIWDPFGPTLGTGG